METHARKFRLVPLLLVMYLASATGAAQTYEVVHAFVANGGHPAGPLVYSPSGALYGTTQDGGAFARGSVYSLTPDGSGGFAFLTVYSFRGPDGATPSTALIFGADGNLYGTTSAGGAVGAGTVFRLETSGSLTRVHDFADGGGKFPTELVLASDGAFYGTASAGGDHDGGTVFRLGPDEVFSTVHSFDGAVEGTAPLAGLLQVGAYLYGTTSAGGTGGFGTTFRVDLAGTLTTLHSFDGTDGRVPSAALIQGLDGNLYGTTRFGGPLNLYDDGTIFRMDLSGNVTTFHTFTFVDGTQPLAPLIQAADGKFYGTTWAGNDGGGKDMFPAGTAFRIDSLGNLEKVYWFFEGLLATPGSRPSTAMVDGHDGYLYGTTIGNLGSVYRVDLAGNLSFISFFGGDGQQFSPTGGLTEANGALYGTTRGNSSAIFRLDGPDATVLHQFGPDGFRSLGGLLLASDGALYGTTVGGGSGAKGTTFRLNIGSSGTYETLHDFVGTDGTQPLAGLVESPDGEFFGTTLYDGADLYGTVFHMDASGTVTTLHSFNNTDGNEPWAELIHAADGNFYGTTIRGGANGLGVIFSMNTLGTVTSVHEFAGSDGSNPSAGLVQANDGAFYGVTDDLDIVAPGTIYRLDGSGMLTTLHAFTNPDGTLPASTLIQASDDMLYGTAEYGGSNGAGTIFRTDTLGNFEMLHDFNGLDGANPLGRLLEASDGAIYGEASAGGVAGGGVVFRLLHDVPTPSVIGIAPSSGRAAGGTPVAISGDHLYAVTTVSIGGIAATPPAALDQRTLFSVSPALTPGTLNDVTVAATSVRSGPSAQTLAAAWLANFSDVPQDDIFHSYVETIFRGGITAGCGSGNYCRNNPVHRDQMAVFLLKAEHGSAYAPPACTSVFPDVACPSPFADWIEQLATEGVTAGCGGGNYCPGDPVTRRQMAVFLLKTKEGSSYEPPAAVGIFNDVPQSDSFAPWIEELSNREITGGCQVSPPLYCPANPNTRGQMAVFLVKTFGL